MSKTSPCPPEDDLRRLALGQAGPVESEAFAIHLGGCLACAERLEILGVQNGLVSNHNRTSPISVDEKMQALIQRIAVLGEGSISGQATAMSLAENNQATRIPLPESNASADLTQMLAPARAEGELGWLGPYRVLKILGAGGMGVVFQAEDGKLQRLVAIKAIQPQVAGFASAGERFLREARAMAKVKHEHVATIYEVGEDRGIPYLAMEYLEGESLAKVLAAQGKLPIPRAIALGRQIAQGLAAAHAQGLIHRDIKPDNIWIEPRDGGHVKLLDFGLARVVATTTGEKTITLQGGIVGTPAYMSPEQAHGKPLDPRTDLFSFGVVLYRMVTGQAPFVGADVVSTLVAVSTHQPPPARTLNPDISEAFSEFIDHLLAKNPEDRVGSAAQAVARLDLLAGPSPIRKAIPGRKIWPAAVLLVSVIAVGTWLTLTYFSQTVPEVDKPSGPKVVRDVDRRAAEFIFAAGGLVELADSDKGWLTSKSELPDGPFTIRAVEMVDRPRVDLEQLGLLLGDLEGLRTLLLIGMPVDDNWFAKLAASKTAGNLENLTLNRSRLSSASLGQLSQFFNLVYLEMNHAKVTDEGMQHLEKLQHLKHLGLEGNAITGKAIRQISKLLVSTLYLGHNPSMDDEAVIPLGDMNSLRVLGIEHTNLTDVGLARLVKNKNLTRLNLLGTRVTNNSMPLVAQLDNLDTLWLDQLPIMNQGLAKIAGMKSLGLLSLNATRVGDEGIEFLRGNDILHTLNLDSLPTITFKGLTVLTTMKSLRSVSLRDTRLTREELIRLRESLPNCQFTTNSIDP